MQLQSQLMDTPLPADSVTTPSNRKDLSTLLEILTLEELRENIAQWTDLVDNALEPNIFYEPHFLLAALRHLDATNVEVAIARDGANPDRWLGVFPIVRENRYLGLPLKSISLWRHMHCFLCTPHLRKGSEVQALSAMLDWVDGEASFLCINDMSGTGPVHDALLEVLRARGRFFTELERISRYALVSSLQPEEYLKTVVGSRRLKDIRRKSKLLQSEGEVKCEVLANHDDLPAWIEQFHALETSSWKGEKGTALGQCSNQAAFFSEILGGACAQNTLHFIRLTAGGRPVAIRCAFLSGKTQWSFKIAYDEAFAKSSPGLLLEIENIQQMLTHPEINFLDSCGAPKHPMFARIWNHQRELCSVVIATKRRGSQSLLRLVTKLRQLKRKFKGGSEEQQIIVGTDAAEAGEAN